MFAFCPSINHQKCGISSSNDLTDMGLKAGLDIQHVKSNELRYEKRSSWNTKGEYDACYYEISFDESILMKYDPKTIHMKVTKKSMMNVYIYGGKSRLEATLSIIPGNNQVEIDQIYSIDVDTGFLLVAYPIEN